MATARSIMLGPRSSQPRLRSPRATLLAAALVVGALFAIAGVVQAALPPRGASFKFHAHATAGKNWHIEFIIDPKDKRRIKTLVLYSQQCKATIAKTGVPISDAGVVAVSGGLRGGGSWAVNATFNEPTTLVGTMQMTRADCDTGLLSYPNATTGNGYADDMHGGGGHHGQKYPDFARASPKQRSQARGLHRRVLRTWRGITPAKAARLGFFRDTKFTRKLGVFHVYNQSYEKDARIFDARRPESIVFWRRAKGHPVILGLMFRVARGKRPRFAGPIPSYHNHDRTGNVGMGQMTHVWMVKDSTSAWANCLPVEQLEQYNPAFKWMPGRAGIQHVGKHC